MNKDEIIYVSGHSGMVGSAITKMLKNNGYKNLIMKSREEVDLINQESVNSFFYNEKPSYVFMAAAKVGGINANNKLRAQFLYDNLMIQNNIIHSSHENKVKKLLFLGSACIYPYESKQPIKEEFLLTDKLEPTNEPYAIAKIAGIKMCENYYRQYGDNFISVMPNNLYGPNDNFDLNTSHVLPALMRKIHEAKINNYNSVEIWGTGTPKREFLHVDDLANACLLLMNKIDAYQLYDDSISHINIGSGEELTIHELALLLIEIIDYSGDIVFNKDYPDGMHRKLLDISRINSLGWKARINLKEGLENTYNWFLDNQKKIN